MKTAKAVEKFEVKELDALGIEYEKSYSDKGKVHRIRLDFSAREWYGIINTEGEYLSICCGTISEMRDILIECLRFDCWIKMDDFRRLIQLGDSHGCTQAKSGPVKKLASIWKIVEPHAEAIRVSSCDFNDTEDAIFAIGQLTNHLAHDYIMGIAQNVTKADRSRCAANTRVTLGKLMACLHTILNKIPKEHLKPFVGYAIRDKKTKEICDNRSMGLFIYGEKADAEKVLARSEDAADFEIVKVKITLDKGIEVQ